jgi:arylsulfatase A-like enzyme
MVRILLVSGTLLLLAATPAPVQGQTPKPAPGGQSPRPNVVLIVADDLGYADLGCQGQSKDVKTPSIDSLAAGGIRFVNGYVSCPVCSPTRAGLLTGRYQQRFGFEQNPRNGGDDPAFGLPTDQVLLPQLLKQAGYATGAIGKWHLGHKPEMRPLQRGFDEFFGFLGGAHRYINNQNPDPQDNNVVRRGDQPVGEKEYLTDAFTREAVSFIDRHQAGPFFLYLAYNAPHSPLQAPEKYLARFPDVSDSRRRTFCAMVSALDDGVGQVLAHLREHQLETNTLVIFMSDNGGPTPGNTSLNTPFRGRKGQTLEGGIHVPFMMRWAGHLPAGKVEERMLIQLDLFPTLCALAGARLPAGLQLDGVDLLPYLAGHNPKPIHTTFYWRFGPWGAIRSENLKLQWDSPQHHLYDLSQDLGEAHDLAASAPGSVQRLETNYQAWSSQLMKPRWVGRLEGGGGGAGADDEAEPGSAPARRRPGRN